MTQFMTAVIITIGATARKKPVMVPCGTAIIEASITAMHTRINENPLAHVEMNVVTAGANGIFTSISL